MWEAYRFEDEVRKSQFDGEGLEHILRLKEKVFDPSTGCLTWDSNLLRRMWKREECIFDKYTRHFEVFLKDQSQSPASAAASNTPAEAAFSRFVNISATSPGLASGCFLSSEPCALIELQFEPSPISSSSATGSQPAPMHLTGVRTPTFQRAMLWLLERICEHSMDNPLSEVTKAMLMRWNLLILHTFCSIP
jgi:hypothetical protein